MSDSIPASTIERWYAFFGSEADSSIANARWLEDTLSQFPELACRRLPDGELPLRKAMVPEAPATLFRTLLEHGAELDVITAAAVHDLQNVERQLQHDPDLAHETDHEGNTPLHWAVSSRYAQQRTHVEELVSCLLDAGAQIDAHNTFGESPLDRAVLDVNLDACDALLEAGATPTLLAGIAFEEYDFLHIHLDGGSHTLDWRSPRDSRTLLHLAIEWECSEDMLQFLLDHGALNCLEATYGHSCRTPLLYAIFHDEFEAAEFLLRSGADPNVRERRTQSCLHNQTALAMAIGKDRVGLAENLISSGADAQERGKYDESLLCRARSAEMTELLLRAGLDPERGDANDRDALWYAIEEGRADVVDVLIRSGISSSLWAEVVLGDVDSVAKRLDYDPTLINTYHRTQPVPSEPHEPAADAFEFPLGSIDGTPLHCAVKAGTLQMVELLIERGADPNAKTQPAGWTPLHDATYYSIMNDHRFGPEIIKVLVTAGADLHATTWGGYRPLDIADYLSFRDEAADIFDLLASLMREPQ